MSSTPPCPGVLHPLCLNMEVSSLPGSLWGVAHSCLQASWDSDSFSGLSGQPHQERGCTASSLPDRTPGQYYLWAFPPLSHIRSLVTDDAEKASPTECVATADAAVRTHSTAWVAPPTSHQFPAAGSAQQGTPWHSAHPLSWDQQSLDCSTRPQAAWLRHTRVQGQWTG